MGGVRQRTAVTNLLSVMGEVLGFQVGEVVEAVCLIERIATA
jgi:hypothetical protein